MDAGELVRVYFEDVFTRGSPDRAEEIAAAEYVEHATMPFGTDEPGRVHGPQHLRQTAGWLRAQFPDLRMEVERVAVDGDVVAALVVTSGTNLGMLNGVLPATGRRFTARQSHWFRVADGLLAEHWATREDLPTMIQLGVVAAPGPPPA